MIFLRLGAVATAIWMVTAPLAADTLHFVGMAVLPSTAVADGAKVGGLSGIDYDAKDDIFLAISDDKSEAAPARFLALKLDYDRTHVETPVITATVFLRDAKGMTFPPPGTGSESLDSESLRRDPANDTLLISTEGDTKDGFGPAIRRFSRQGALLGEFALPPQLAFDPEQKKGPRTNLSLEGLSFDRHGRVLWASMEAPLFQDGPVPSPEAGAPVRFLRRENNRWRQYVYEVDPLHSGSAGRIADNGVSEILALDNRHLLVLERSGIKQDDGDFHFFARLYCATTRGASDVSALTSLAGQAYRPMKKKLLFDFAGLTAEPADNVEGITWGRPLENGNRSLVLVTDNNFSSGHQTQFLVLEVQKGRPLCGA